MQGTTKQSDLTIGLNLGDKRSQAVVLNAGGEEIEERSVATTWEAFERELFANVGDAGSSGDSVHGGLWCRSRLVKEPADTLTPSLN